MHLEKNKGKRGRERGRHRENTELQPHAASNTVVYWNYSVWSLMLISINTPVPADVMSAVSRCNHRDPEASGGLSDHGCIDAAALCQHMTASVGFFSMFDCWMCQSWSTWISFHSQFYRPAAGLHDVTLQHHREGLGKCDGNLTLVCFMH